MMGIIGSRKFWIWIFLIAVVLFLLSSNSGQRSTWNPAERFIIEITAPLQKFLKNTIKAVEDFWLDYFYLVNVRQENRALKREIDALRLENSRYREILATHDRLQELLHFKQAIHMPALAAQVIARDPTGWFKSIVIDKGLESGLKLNMPVVNASGVVGRIVSVSRNYAKVLLVIDQNSAVDCLIQSSRDRGMVKGLSAETCTLEYVSKSSTVTVGDMIVTSGLGGVFPKGLPVGKVVKAKEVRGELFKDIEITPAVDFSKLEEVLVITEEKASSRDQAEQK